MMTTASFSRWAGPGTRVALVSGSYGAGHDAAAKEIRLRLERLGAVVDEYDVNEHFPLALGRLLRFLYYTQLRLLPSSWGELLNHLDPGSPLHRFSQRLLRAAGPSLAEVAERHDLLVATHPFAGQALGDARASGELDVPVLTYLTDPSVHPLWVHPGVDLHLALHEVAAEQARGWGGRADVVETLEPGSCTAYGVVSRDAVRAGLDLPVAGPFALVCGGSEGFGDLARTARDILATGTMTPVVLCGHNERLRRRLERRSGVVALGWRDDVPALMRAAECVVQNAGGFTCREAVAVGTPLLSYRCLPGHGRANAEAMQQAGHATWLRSRAELATYLQALVADESLPMTG